MRDWNVVVTVHEHHFSQACRFLEAYGQLAKSDFFNVLTMRVSDIGQFLHDLHQQLQDEPVLAKCVARVLPVGSSFVFQSPAEFELKAQAVVAVWVEKLSGTRFHVRMHRRGFKGRMSSQDEERFIDHYLMQCLSERGATAEMNFEDPDYIIAVETIGQQAGMSLWSRDELQRYPLIKLD